MKVVRKTKKTSPLKVYDFTVENAHHYILDNGIVSHNSYVPTRTMAGGGGIAYAASNIIDLSKKKDKDGTDVIGNIVRAKMSKSRFSREQKVVELRANFEKGLERYFGLLPLAEKYSIIKRIGNKYEMPDGSKHWEKELAKEPEKFYTKDILDKLDVVAKKEFALGSTSSGDLEISPNYEVADIDDEDANPSASG